MAKKKIIKKKKTIPIVEEGKIYINSSFNNTIICATDKGGNVLAWGSAGTSGFKETRKSTPFAATTTMKNVLEKLSPYGLKKVAILVKGVGTGRESAIRVLQGTHLKVTAIKDTTPLPHGGVRPKKARRV